MLNAGMSRENPRQAWLSAGLALMLSIAGIGLAGCSGVVSGNNATNTGGGGGSDTTAPQVAITSPAAGATVSGSVNLTANATDNVAVASVQFKVDGANAGSALTAAPYSYLLNTSSLSNASHSITAVATDAAGNAATSAAVSVTVNNSTPDTTPPTVSVTAPANGASVSGTVSVTANASDNVSVASVQFQLDSANVGSLLTAAPYVFSWNSASASNGSHTLRAIAKDGAGNSTTSASVSVTVSNTTDTTAPTVSITAPASGATVSGTVSVTATASDNVGVASVQFQLDGANAGSLDTTSPYAYSWNTSTASNGSHTVRAIAKDAAGNATTSAGVTVTVSNTADTTAPSTPAGLTASAASSSQINLSWNASTDNVGVTGYNVLRGGTKVGTSTTTSYQDNGLNPSTSYSYTVSAFDAAGNTSSQSASSSATTFALSGGGGIPTTLGWYQIPNTQVQSVCATYTDVQGSTGCISIVGDWSGGIADTTRNRLLIWGGGHVNYFGNEFYSLNLTANPITITRLNEPTRFSSNSNSCNSSGAYWDGKPCSRHTYGGITYVPSSDQMVVFGGSKTPDGSFGTSSSTIDVWKNSIATLAWTSLGGNFSSNINTCCPMSTYDPNTGLVFFHDSSNLYTFNASTNAYTEVDGGSSSIRNGLAQSALVVDPVHKWLFVMGGSGGGGTGGNLYRYDISGNPPYPRTDLLSGAQATCSQWVGTTSSNSANRGPGVEWYPVRNKIVMWNGGNSVGIYDPVANSCTTETYANGPANAVTGGAGAEQYTGTQGRFRYFPALGVFALVNDATQNAYLLRIDPPSGGTGSTGPAISGVGASAISTSGATIGWTTDVGSTSQVEYGTTTAYGTLTTVNSSMVTAHSVPLSGLGTNTLYHYRAHSQNSSGVESISGDFAFQTNNTTDATPPTVSITAPALNATLSGAVTVSANASDNVGVTSVQFQVDGANIGSPVTASPYTTSWNTATATNGVHILTAQASDAAGNIGTAVGVSVNVSNSTSSADQNFQARCTAPGVLNCQGFDSAFVQGSQASKVSGFIGQGNPANTVRDSSVFVSGGSSVRYTWPQNDATDNCCQDYWAFFGDGSNNQVFGQNSTFYVQFAFRADSTWATRGWVTDTYPKLNIIYNSDVGSCAANSLVTVNMHAYSLPNMYTSCSGTELDTQDDGATWSSGGNWNQSGWTAVAPFTGYQCGYASGQRNSPNCFNFQANTWYTIYYKVSVGTWGTNSSSVEAWVAPYGQQLKKWLNVHNLSISQDGAGFNVMSLTQYMTNHSASGVNPQASVWFDELIISNQPIAAPGGQTP